MLWVVFFSSTQLQDYEALGVASIINNLTIHFSSVFMSLPKELCSSFVDIMTKLTCNFCQAAAREEAVRKMIYITPYWSQIQYCNLLHKGKKDSQYSIATNEITVAK